MTPNAIAKLDERLRAFETARVSHQISLPSGALAFAAPQLRCDL